MRLVWEAILVISLIISDILLPVWLRVSIDWASSRILLCPRFAFSTVSCALSLTLTEASVVVCTCISISCNAVATESTDSACSFAPLERTRLSCCIFSVASNTFSEELYIVSKTTCNLSTIFVKASPRTSSVLDMCGLKFRSPAAIFSAEMDCSFILSINCSSDFPILPNSSWRWLILLNAIWSIDSGLISPLDTVFNIISATDRFLLIGMNVIMIIKATTIDIIIPTNAPISVSLSEILSRACFSTAETRYQPVLSILLTDPT